MEEIIFMATPGGYGRREFSVFNATLLVDDE